MRPPEWNDDDYDVLADGVVVGRIFQTCKVAARRTLDVDLALRLPRGSLADTRLQGDTRGCDELPSPIAGDANGSVLTARRR